MFDEWNLAIVSWTWKGWGSPEHRGKGISKLLLNKAIRYANKEWNAKMIWSKWRESALAAYLSVGYEQTTDFFNEGVEFGPNCYVRMELWKFV